MNTYRRINAVKTTAAVLRYLSSQKEAVSPQSIAEGIGEPTGTLMCHLVTLEDEGLVRCVGGGWELGMGLGLFWARYKSQAEGKIDRLRAELQQLEG